MAIEGVDYAFSKPSASALVAAGKHFACRYGGPGSDSKQLHAAELAALTAAGIEVVANAEGAASGFRGTAAGRSWASDALAHFNALGMPAGRPIYFSVDWDAISTDWPDIDAALRGAASVIGADRVGVYGSYDVMQHCRAVGTARWFWQTYAWSGGRQPASFVHLYQYRNGVTIGGADCDLTRALLPDYGQWGLTGNGVDDVSKQDVTDALNDFFATGWQDDAKTQQTSRIGRDAFNQGVPNPFTGSKSSAWALMQSLGNALIDQKAQITALTTKVNALSAAQNPQALADAVTAAVVAALPEATGSLSSDQLQAVVEAGVHAEMARAFTA